MCHTFNSARNYYKLDGGSYRCFLCVFLCHYDQGLYNSWVDTQIRLECSYLNYVSSQFSWLQFLKIDEAIICCTQTGLPAGLFCYGAVLLEYVQNAVWHCLIWKGFTEVQVTNAPPRCITSQMHLTCAKTGWHLSMQCSQTVGFRSAPELTLWFALKKSCLPFCLFVCLFVRRPEDHHQSILPWFQHHLLNLLGIFCTVHDYIIQVFAMWH